MNNPIICGIDPGSQKCGIAFISKIENRINLIASYQVPLKGTSQSSKLHNLSFQANKILADNEFDSVVVEDIFIDKSGRYSKSSPLGIAYSKGVLLACLGKYSVPIIDLNNKTVKKIICGNGNSTKQMLNKRINSMFEKEFSEDESSAIALACTYLLGAQNEKIVVTT